MKRLDNNDSNKRKLIKKEYVFILILTAVAIFIFLTGQELNFSIKKDKEVENADYLSSIETRLENLLSTVKGVGKIKVFINVDGSNEEIVLKSKEEKVVNGVKTTIESVVLVGGKPYVIKTENPKIIGVVIVCEGADDLSVKMVLNEIVITTLKVDADNVRIIKMK